MSYNEAYNLNEGDKVIIIDTQEHMIVESIRGTTDNMFIILNNGRAYRHDQIKKI